MSFNLGSRGQHRKSRTLDWNRRPFPPVNKRVFVLALVVALGSQAAWASSISRRVDTARSRHVNAVQTLHGLEAQLGGVRGELSTAVDLLDAATVRLVDARSSERDASIRLALAEDVLVQRVRAAYEQ